MKLPVMYACVRNIIPGTSFGTHNVIEMARIYTATSETGRGVGTALMNKCITVAKQKQGSFIWLGVRFVYIDQQYSSPVRSSINFFNIDVEPLHSPPLKLPVSPLLLNCIFRISWQQRSNNCSAII